MPAAPRWDLIFTLAAAAATLSACCVIVIDNVGDDGGNPFQQQQQQFPENDSGVFPAPVATCKVTLSSAVPDGGLETPIGGQINFDGSYSEPSPGASEIVAWSWDFGDGTTGTGAEATHAYAAAGNWVTTLTVTDDQGLTAQNSCPEVQVAP